MAEPLHEVACPECGTTIRARMADQPGEDLRAVLVAKFDRVKERALAVEFTDDDGNSVGHMASGHGVATLVLAIDEFLPTVQAYVDSQVAAARADKRRRTVADSPLTEAQAAILTYASNGYGIGSIAARTGLTGDAVKYQLRLAYRALRADGMTHAVAVALRAGWIE